MSAPDEMVAPEWWPRTDSTPLAEAIYSSGACSTWVQAVDVADAVLSVPALAEVIARDAKVRGIVTEFFAPEPHRSAGKPMRANNAFHDIAALYPERET